MRRLLFSIPLSALFLGGCAASEPRDSARSAYEAYYDACLSHHDDDARQMLVASREAPCPDELDPPSDAPILIARRGETTLYHDGHWHILGGYALDSPEMVLRRLMYAVKNNDIAEISSLLGNSVDASAIAEWLKTSEANEFYAEIALHGAPQIAHDGPLATCELLGKALTFVYDGHWFLRALP